MAVVEPVPDAPAAVADLSGERALVVADYHAGIEVGLRYQRGVELDSAASERRERLLGLLDRTDADRVVVLGDLAHRIAAPEGEEREELAALVEAVTDRVPLTLVVGNHDPGVVEAFAADLDVIPAGGVERPRTRRLPGVQRALGRDVDQRRGAGVSVAVSARGAGRRAGVPPRRDATRRVPVRLRAPRGRPHPTPRRRA